MTDTSFPVSRPVGAGTGLQAVLGGIGFILLTPSVWRHAIVPVVVLGALICLLWSPFGLWMLVLWMAPPEEPVHVEIADAEIAITDWRVVKVVSRVGLLLALLIALGLAQPFSALSLEAIALAQERALTGETPTRLSLFTSIVLAMRVTLVSVLVGGPLVAGLFLFSLCLPSVVMVPLKLLVGSGLLAWNFLDYPLSVRGQGIRQRLGWMAAHRGAVTVFGFVWALLLLVPGIFFLILPMGVAGATRIVVAAEQAQRSELEVQRESIANI